MRLIEPWSSFIILVTTDKWRPLVAAGFVSQIRKNVPSHFNFDVQSVLIVAQMGKVDSFRDGLMSNPNPTVLGMSAYFFWLSQHGAQV